MSSLGRIAQDGALAATLGRIGGAGHSDQGLVQAAIVHAASAVQQRLTQDGSIWATVRQPVTSGGRAELLLSTSLGDVILDLGSDQPASTQAGLFQARPGELYRLIGAGPGLVRLASPATPQPVSDEGPATLAQASTSVQVTLNPQARVIAELASTLAQGSPARPTGVPLQGAPMLPAGPASQTDVLQAAQQLAMQVRQSGLGYEAGLRNWTEGQRTLAQLSQQPQARLNPDTPLEQAVRLADVRAILREQFSSLERSVVRFQGLAWQGQSFGLSIRTAEAGEARAGLPTGHPAATDRQGNAAPGHNATSTQARSLLHQGLSTYQAHAATAAMSQPQLPATPEPGSVRQATATEGMPGSGAAQAATQTPSSAQEGPARPSSAAAGNDPALHQARPGSPGWQPPELPQFPAQPPQPSQAFAAHPPGIHTGADDQRKAGSRSAQPTASQLSLVLPGLGRLEIDLNMLDQHLALEIRTEHQDLLQQAAPDLLKALEARGLAARLAIREAAAMPGDPA